MIKILSRLKDRSILNVNKFRWYFYLTFYLQYNIPSIFGPRRVPWISFNRINVEEMLTRILVIYEFEKRNKWNLLTLTESLTPNFPQWWWKRKARFGARIISPCGWFPYQISKRSLWAVQRKWQTQDGLHLLIFCVWRPSVYAEPDDK